LVAEDVLVRDVVSTISSNEEKTASRETATADPTPSTVQESPKGSEEARRSTILKLHNVSKSFGTLRAVDDLSLDVRRGEILTLLGPSGCGKTTTLRTIIGLERCDGGEIVYDGHVIDSPRGRIFVPTHKRQMGMVFQSYAIWPHMNVFENVAYPLRVRGVGGQRLQYAVSQSLEQVGLGAMAERPATQLSGGQQQRVALARSLVFEPQILLLDEPFSNLDAQLRGQMRAELKLLQRRLGVTVVLVTHDQVEALSVSDRIAVMRQGRLEQLGTPHQLYREPATIAVRDFVGRTIVLDGTVDQVSSGLVSVRLSGSVVIMCRGGAPDSLRNGDRVQVAIRPEHAWVEPASTHAPNELSGTIETLSFIGDHYEARLALEVGQRVMAYLPAVDRWREGQPVCLSLPPEDVRVWEDANVS
jgi:ABC-type Fe3+/spermidine/putrescine transport system ATPase subunit